MTDPIPYRRSHWQTQPEYSYPPYKSTAKRAPTQPLVMPPQTLSEVTGPIFGYDEVKPEEADLTARDDSEPLGERTFVSGRVLDENGRPIPQVLIEIWQANAAGRYRHPADMHDAPLDPNFTGCGRVVTDAEGRYLFKTIKPGAYPWRNHYNAWRPAHIHLSIFGRGFMQRLVTRVYFPDEPSNAEDPILSRVPPERRSTLIARKAGENLLEWNIVLQGADETAFFDY